MIWQFEFIESDSTVTVVDEPAKWDGIVLNLMRNLSHHGIFSNISTDGFEWIEDAYDMLFLEYQTNGANGKMQCRISYKCEGETAFNEYFLGNFDFNTFDRQCSTYCFIKISVNATKCTDTFLSRMGQDVDILTTENFDGDAITPMTYTTLNFLGQDIFLQNKANCEDGCTWDETATDLSGLTGNRFYDIPIFLPNNPLIEIGDFNVNNVLPVIIAKNGALGNISFPLVDGISDFENYFQFMFIYGPTLAECVSTLQIDWRCKGEFKVTPNYNGNITIDLRCYKRNPITNNDLQALGTVNIASASAITNGVEFSISFDESFSGTTTQPLDGSFIVYAWHVNIFKSSASAVDTTAFEVVYDALGNNFFTMETDSSCAPSVCRSVPLPDLLEFLPTAYMDTECPTVVIEETLRGCLDAYSISKGSFIRNVENPSTPRLFTSFEYMFEQCRKIFNIGWGFGNNETELLIGNLEDFYKSNIVVDIGLVGKAMFTTAKDLIYGTITVGYNKWEAEEYNGLDEMNTTRQYRRDIDSNPTELDLMADIISAGYTIEITRRKSQAKTGTSDWRYDDDLFIINSLVDGFGATYAIQGVNVGAANIYSPATRMNYVLTPIRTLLRWFRSIAAPTPTVANERLIFTSGTGNYIATGEMTAACQIENQPIAENVTIDTTIISDFDSGYYENPIWQTIYANFNAPLSMSQMEAIKLDPYGAIRFQCSDNYYVGNIVELNHDPNKGIASFKLLLRR